MNGIMIKKAYKVCFQHLYMAFDTNSARVSRHSVHDLLQKPERGCKKLLTFILCIPIAFYFYLLLPAMPRHRHYELHLPSTPIQPILQLETTTKKNLLEVELKNKTNRKLFYKKSKALIPNLISAIANSQKTHLSSRDPKHIPKPKLERRKNINTFQFSSHVTVEDTTKLPECFYNISGLEKESVNISNVTESLDKVYPMVQEGGYYKPLDCWTSHKLSILVPYRNNSKNLMTFLFNIHPFLMKQKLEYRIFVVEQYSDFNELNKGRLFNAGFKEMKKFGDWRCVVLHDVDLLPLNPRILYTCPTYPRMMSSFIVGRDGNNASYPALFGGVTVMSLEHYEMANGYSNLYWGGGQDYDMFDRLRTAGFPIMRYNKTVAKFLALPNERPHGNSARYRLHHKLHHRWRDEGLSSLDYKVISTSIRHLFTHLLVDINPFKETLIINY